MAGQVTALTNMVPSTGVAVTIGAAILEIGLRFAKTAKPASLFYTAAAVIKSLGALFTKVGMLLDTVLQNVKVPEQVPQTEPAQPEQKSA